jgi:disulfide bond formation protein DsbB
MHAVNMAQACLFAFVICFGLLGAMLVTWVIRDFVKKENKEASIA